MLNLGPKGGAGSAISFLCSPPSLLQVNHDSGWNEEFLLNSFLTYNFAFEVRWAGRYMWEAHRQLLFDALGSKDTQSSDASFYFERVV